MHLITELVMQFDMQIDVPPIDMVHPHQALLKGKMLTDVGSQGMEG